MHQSWKRLAIQHVPAFNERLSARYRALTRKRRQGAVAPGISDTNPPLLAPPRQPAGEKIRAVHLRKTE